VQGLQLGLAEPRQQQGGEGLHQPAQRRGRAARPAGDQRHAAVAAGEHLGHHARLLERIGVEDEAGFVVDAGVRGHAFLTAKDAKERVGKTWLDFFSRDCLSWRPLASFAVEAVFRSFADEGF
jgi:hypothetical protein